MVLGYNVFVDKRKWVFQQGRRANSEILMNYWMDPESEIGNISKDVEQN